MSYKMIVLNMYNKRHHDYYYVSRDGSYVGKYALAARAFLKAWVDAVRDYSNMVVSDEKLTYDSQMDAYYYAIFNDGKIGVSSNSNPAVFGTKKSGDGTYDYTGLTTRFSDFYFGYGSNYTPWSVRCRLFVDDQNNLIASTGLNSLANNSLKGFMFTNGGVMAMDATDIYSMGASPAVMGSIFQSMFTNPAPGRLEVYRSDMLMQDTDGKIDLMDHVQYIWSPEISRGGGGLFEEVTIDGQKYIHMGVDASTQYKVSGLLWLPVDEIEEREVEVFIHEGT